MFSIKINAIVEEGNNLENELSKMSQEIYEVEHVLQNLSSLSCMEEIQNRLRVQLRNLNEEKQKLSKMIKSLNKIILYYNSSENRIQDYVEQEVVFYRRYEVGLNNLQNLSDMLKAIV